MDLMAGMEGDSGETIKKNMLAVMVSIERCMEENDGGDEIEDRAGSI
jgi:hypothetical protein